MEQKIMLYADESCHLQKHKTDCMSLVTVYTLENNKNLINKSINTLLASFKMTGELKWAKVSNSNLAMYIKIIDYFSDFVLNNKVRIRAILADVDKETIVGNYDDWYYKMYYLLFDKIISDVAYTQNHFHLLIDIKDNKSHSEAQKLARYLSNRSRGEKIIIGTAEDSRNHRLIQIADIIAGAMTYKFRGIKTSNAKLDLINHIESSFKINLNQSYPLSKMDFNIFVRRLSKNET